MVIFYFLLQSSMLSLSKYSATYMSVFVCNIYKTTQIFSYLYVYFYICVGTLIVGNSVENTKEIYLQWSCLLQT